MSPTPRVPNAGRVVLGVTHGMVARLRLFRGLHVLLRLEPLCLLSVWGFGGCWDWFSCGEICQKGEKGAKRSFRVTATHRGVKITFWLLPFFGDCCRFPRIGVGGRRDRADLDSNCPRTEGAQDGCCLHTPLADTRLREVIGVSSKGTKYYNLDIQKSTLAIAIANLPADLRPINKSAGVSHESTVVQLSLSSGNQRKELRVLFPPCCEKRRAQVRQVRQ